MGNQTTLLCKFTIFSVAFQTISTFFCLINRVFRILSTIVWWIFIIFSWKILTRTPSTYAYSKSTTYFSAFLILFGVALANTLFVSFTSTTRGLSTVSQFISWTMLREYKCEAILSINILLTYVLSFQYLFRSFLSFLRGN